MGGRRDADSILLALPGLMHNLGNALFAIHGQAQRLGRSAPDPEAGKAAILRAVSQAQGGLEVLRHLAEEAHRPVQAGILLHRLCGILSIPARERGLRLDLHHSSRETPESVDGSLLCRSVALTFAAILDGLPPGLSGSLDVDLVTQTDEHLDIVVRVRVEQGHLPFPLGLDSMIAELGERLRGSGATVHGPEPENGLRLRLPSDQRRV